MSTQENSEIRNIRQFFPDMVSEIWLAFPGHLIFWCETFFTTLLGTLQNYKIPQDSIPCTLGQKKSIVCKEYRICIDFNGIWAVLRIPKYYIPLDFWRYRENGLTFSNWFFATCFKFSWSNTNLPGALDLDPGSQGKPLNPWCVSFETECSQIRPTIHHGKQIFENGCQCCEFVPFTNSQQPGWSWKLGYASILPSSQIKETHS